MSDGRGRDADTATGIPRPSASTATSAAAAAPALRRVRGPRAGEPTTVLDALRWIQRAPGPLAGDPPLVPPRLVRHLRRPRERARGAGVRRRRLADRERDRDGRAAREHAGAHRPRRRHARRSTRASRASTRSCARSEVLPDGARRPMAVDGLRAVRGLHRVRPLPVGVPGRRDRRRATSGRPRSRAAQRVLEEPRGADRETLLGLGRRRRRRVALPRRLRVHRGLPVGRPPGRADHGAARREHRARLGGADRRRERRRRPRIPARPAPRAGTGAAQGARAHGAWFDVRAARRRGTGPSRSTASPGSASSLYLYLHLGRALACCSSGESAWNGFLGVATTPAFLGLDVLLIFGLLFHGLNGVRVALVGSGLALEPPAGAVLVADGRSAPSC